MPKTLGIILILISSVMFLFIKHEKIKEALKNLCQMKKAVTYIKHELSFSFPEMSHLCKTISSRTNGGVSEAFLKISQLLDKNENMDFQDAWQSASDNVQFSKRAEEEILNFAKSFGKKCLTIELENIEKTEKALELLIGEETQKYQTDKKLIYTLGMSVTVVLIILVI